MAAKHSITQEQLKKLLHYDPDTGVFTWLVNRRVHAGDIAGSIKNRTGYRRIFINGRTYFAHRIAWLYMTGIWPPNYIDHINRDRLDNRWSNLRLATKSENTQNVTNARSNSKSGLLGVYKANKQSWATAIRANGKVHYLGCYSTPELAHEAYLRAKRELHPFAPKDAHVEEIP